jgi:hypothetical protein
MSSDRINEALKTCVEALGGAKQVGPRLWPDKTLKSAQTLLLNALNENRPERLAPEQLLQIFRWARDAGCHAGMECMAQELGYAEPVPIDPVDQVADLQRRFISQVDQLAEIMAQINRLQPGAKGLRSVA